MISVRKISLPELTLLTKIFNYNNVDSMIEENTKLISCGIGDIFCIFNDDIPFGVIYVKYISDNPLFCVKGLRAYLYAFTINKEYRGKGYGKLLLESVLHQLETEGYREFTIAAGVENHRAIHIYSSFGFNKVLLSRTESLNGKEYSYALYLKS